MLLFLRRHYPILVIVALWIFLAATMGELLYAALPLSVLFLRSNDRWGDILFGFIICLVLSDMSTDVQYMIVMKTAKYTYILVLLLVFITDRERMMPYAKIFTIFLPFFVYAFLPILDSPDPFFSFEKTVSYVILYLVVPNFVLYNFRLHGWDFIKNLIWFVVVILVTQRMVPLVAPPHWVFLEDRFRGYFGNPNGLAIFCYLVFMLFYVANHLKRGLFSLPAQIIIYGILAYYLIICGSRTSLMSTIMFVIFIRFFKYSTFLGIISFIAFIAIGEVVASNMYTIINYLGLQDYMRVDTIADGSGRYFAWNFAWQKLNEGGFFLFGGGFVNDELIMYNNRHFLSSMGHQGGVHNSYLTLWLNVGIVGILIFLRSYALLFIKAGKHTPISYAVMFSVLFSILYESWLAGSLNPYTIMLLIILTIISEDEIMGSAGEQEEEAAVAVEVPLQPPAPLLPAR